ncbi:LPXTG cell wall anchor domain-containing protein [Methanolobus sp.]|uniref:COG1361 S-layer family protein n=1 Tax=Methanolobus sp. TaxID=1874737 RepID=UPI0025F7BAE4|nr:LPXTG cell wall anchor domain-containing protein [Methanolobus sp.]
MTEINDIIRKILGTLICLGMIFTLFTPVSASSGANLKVDVLDYDPYPAEIGKYVDVRVKVENIGYGRADAVSLKIEPDYPFSLDSDKNAIKFIGILTPEKAVVHEYRLFVDENAKVGTGSIDIFYKADDGDAWFKKTVDLRVGSNTFDSKGTIQLSDISSDPTVFMPGDRGTVSFTLQNTATTSSVTIDGNDYDTNARVQSATLRGTDGITVISDTYAGSGVIGPGDSITLNYNIRIDDNVEDGTYYLDFYMVGNSHAYNNNWRIPVKVDSSAIKVIPSKPLIITNGEGVFEFDVANSHPNTLNSVSVRLVSDDLEFSPEEYYIGSMGSDELFTIQIKARSTGTESSVPLSIEVDYRNGMNSHSNQVGTRNASIVQENNSNTGTLAVTAIGLALLLGLPGMVLYRRKKQNNK